MPRHGRYFLPDQPLHAIQRGNNRAAIFFCILQVFADEGRTYTLPQHFLLLFHLFGVNV